MLSLQDNSLLGEKRLVIHSGIAEAWISYHPPSFDPHDRHDWRLWVKRHEYEPALSRKSPTRLLIESRLRAWLLQRFHKRLSDLRFEELCQIAQGKEKKIVYTKR